MRIETNIPDRKTLAKAISEWIHEPVHYDGVPRCSYSIGPVKVEHDGAIACDNSDAWMTLMPFFQNHGWLEAAEAELPAPIQEQNEKSEEAENENGTDDDFILTPPVLEPPTITETSVGIPLNTLNVAELGNLLRLVYTRQDLINAMAKADTVFIDEEVITLLDDTAPDTVDAVMKLVHDESVLGMLRGIAFSEDRLNITLPYDANDPTAWQPMARLFIAMADKAREAHRVSSKRITPAADEMKYFCNSLLNQLGFGGAAHKALRKALLGHLTGYAAFRSTDKMNAHKARMKEQRTENTNHEGGDDK